MPPTWLGLQIADGRSWVFSASISCEPIPHDKLHLDRYEERRRKEGTKIGRKKDFFLLLFLWKNLDKHKHQGGNSILLDGTSLKGGNSGVLDLALLPLVLHGLAMCKGPSEQLKDVCGHFSEGLVKLIL